jgi:CheY-like chemotaxis protein
MAPLRPVEVLLVEDNAGDILMVKQALAGERYPVSINVAVDGKQALDMLAGCHFDPDLVILDFESPETGRLVSVGTHSPECTCGGVQFVHES